MFNVSISILKSAAKFSFACEVRIVTFIYMFVISTEATERISMQHLFTTGYIPCVPKLHPSSIEKQPFHRYCGHENIN